MYAYVIEFVVIRGTVRIAESGEEEEYHMAEHWSHMEGTSKKQRRGEGVSTKLKLMKDETACMLDDPDHSAWEKE